MYTVIWLEAVLDRLAELYVACDLTEQRRMSDGVDALNRRMSTDPHAVGESRGGTLRIAFPPLLSVSFRVIDSSHVVRVVGVSRYGH